MMGMRDNSRRARIGASRASDFSASEVPSITRTRSPGRFSIATFHPAIFDFIVFLCITERPYYKQNFSAISNHKIRFWTVSAGVGQVDRSSCEPEPTATRHPELARRTDWPCGTVISQESGRSLCRYFCYDNHVRQFLDMMAGGGRLSNIVEVH